MWQVLTNKIRKAFSDAADRYDILTTLHKEIGRELVKKTVRLDADRILDVGCGTGYVANKAKFFFPESTIIGLDIAEGMLKKAQALHEGVPLFWLQADAEALPLKAQAFELVLSNLAYQWVGQLPRAFSEAYRVLTPKGQLFMTMFGQRTCEELFNVLTHCASGKAVSFSRLPSIEQVKDALQQAGFDNASVDYELIKVQFRDVLELLGWLKGLGANHLGGDFFLGKDMLARVDKYYRDQFPYYDGISASFEVIWVNAQK